MEHSPTTQYLRLLDELSTGDCRIPGYVTSTLLKYAQPIYRSEREKKYSEPMVWIGLYIACASLVCILTMVADLLHGMRRGKLWFPCKYFRINSAFLTVISVAMKLPVDLSGSMPGDVDQVAKLGSMAFMCTMMANLLPCLSTMDNNALWSNITALCLLVITMVVNICIQIQTGVVSYKEVAPIINVISPLYEVKINKDRNIILASIYVTLLLWLLLVHVCSCLAILKSKKIIESKYQQGHDRALKEIKQSSGELLTVEQLQKHVKNHWIMAGSGSPQFITACFRTTSASGVICVFVTILHTLTMFWSIDAIMEEDCDSDYGRSMIAIVIVQFIGVVIGTIAPLSRCFAALSFKVSLKIVSNDFKVFKLKSYWTSKLYDWKRASLKLPFRNHSLSVIIETSKKLILYICIEFQGGFVVVCKILALIPFVFIICVLYCFRCLKWLLHKYCFSSSFKQFSSLEEKTNFLERNEDLRPYVLQLEDEMELAKRTLEGLSKSVNRLIQNGEKSHANDNLMRLIEQNPARGFLGVAEFDNTDEYDMQHVPFLLLKVEHQNCWSLPVVTLTTIAILLPKIKKVDVDNLLKGVEEGLRYVKLVEENLNATNDFVSVQEAAKTLWKEVDIDHKWLGHKLQDPSSQVKTTRQIVEWFRDTSENIVYSEVASRKDDSKGRSMCANSMYRITKTILSTNSANIDDEDSQKELFGNLSSMITDIITACLTNLPQVIEMKCHTSAIEIREASVKDAARLLGESTKIIETLQRHGISGMNPSDLPFIHKWRAYLRNH
ncbi:hypothetical protein HanPI659440_Chr10g0398221 [Helianthus annuus]|uniref:Uncharacterized protein n=1 Tax=Helianthus annuus TaxID=4232 RepID=A0A251TPV9_HELAN|nr:hypothetical protein HanXRQr2_Chr10g0463831 [Helianthus annuus]KAJ0523996.1 hypothetical protein HanIR_Chr10g0499761 [Helianthus annuus]KAJ0745397.1 hypothetical protein HanPI659440_Chr10g0398221 [Helianthus annuus]KAJ0885661.1 hypothetical protein HanPSC8_Chr10g0447641 [Helianthus annuus]